MSAHEAKLIDGRAVSKQLREMVARRVAALRDKGRPVRLDAVMVDHDGSASARLYAMNQAKMCDRLGIEYKLHELPANAKFDDIAGRVLLLNSDPDAYAVMVHLPLPDAVDTYRVQSLIAPEKDVEGVNPANIGNIVYGRVSLAPCTASAVMKLIDSTGVDVRGKFCVCVGASDIVGKPAAVMLMRREATVISCNKFTDNITDLTKQADVLISAAGVAGLVTIVVLLVSLLFGGFLANIDTIPVWLGWLRFLSIFYYAYEILIVNEIEGLNVNFDAASLDVDVKGDLFLDVFDFNADNLPRDIAALFAMYVGLLLLAYVLLWGLHSSSVATVKPLTQATSPSCKRQKAQGRRKVKRYFRYNLCHTEFWILSCAPLPPPAPPRPLNRPT